MFYIQYKQLCTIKQNFFGVMKNLKKKKCKFGVGRVGSGPRVLSVIGTRNQIEANIVISAETPPQLAREFFPSSISLLLC